MYHKPVLLEESIEWLNIQPNGVYVDLTFGGGGHAKAILDRLGKKGCLIGFDQDDDAQRNLIDDERFIFAPVNFRHLKRSLKAEGFLKVDGILADLGVSSHQFDEGERGFSYRYDFDLDMRMNQHESKTAADVLNHATAEELQYILGEYGEVRNARTLAHAIYEDKKIRKIETIGDLLRIAEPHIKGLKHRYLAQVFQALRIAVNDEVGALKDMLLQSLEVLKPKGRLVVISYHSLEDRLVKNMMKTGNPEGIITEDKFGNKSFPMNVLTKKIITPSKEEIKNNSRASSAKLRVAEKVEV